MAGSDSSFDSSGHGIVNLDPYIQRTVTDATSTYGPRTLYVTSTTVWLTAGTAGGAENGTPLSGFANAVEGALGPSQGALSMISLASPGGALNLEETAVADATAAGTGSVNGVDVTYYDVTIDMAKLADTPDLTDVQRATIAAALPLLRQGGYSGTTERIGVDSVGYIREITATNHFSDGSTGTRHSVLSNFGCAPKITPPRPGRSGRHRARLLHVARPADHDAHGDFDDNPVGDDRVGPVIVVHHDDERTGTDHHVTRRTAVVVDHNDQALTTPA